MNSKKTDLMAQLFPDQKIGLIHSLISNVKVRRLLCILMIILLSIQLKAQVIPYTEALNKAAIVQSHISNMDTNGIIIGNGDINALIYSAKDELIMHPAKNDVWDARLITVNDKPLLKVNVEAHSWTGGSQPPSWNTPYPTQTPPALIRIQSSGKVKEARMDLRSAMASILTSTGKTTIRALAQKNVYFIETDRKVILEGFPQTFLPPSEITQSDGMTIVKQHLPEDPDYSGMDVYTVLGSKGNSHAISVVTSRESADALSDAKNLVKSILAQKSSVIIKAHEDQWKQFWSRSGVMLDDNDLQNWWYRELYYMRCLSAPGAYAIALQGGYNKRANWHGTWTQNYNAEQTFWPVFNTNHVELSEPYINLINDYRPRARWFAKTVFNCEGAVTPHNLWPFEKDPEQCVSVNKRQFAFMPWSYGIGTAGHGAQNLWLHYVYSPDKTYLKEKVYPAIKEYAIFYASFIEKCRLVNGKAVLGPSVDPEHTEYGWDNSPYDIAWVQHTLKAAIQGAKDLGVDADLVTRWSNSLSRVPDYPVIGDVVRVGEQERNYNIITPVVPLFPAEQVSWFSPESEKALFKRTIEWIQNHYNHNNSQVMINVARAHLSMTDDAVNDTKKWFKGKEQPNGLFYWQAHGFYMSEQTAVAGLITEFLLQSVDNIIRVFPSWPGAKDAEFSNLRARGGFLVCAKQKGGTISDLKVESTAGGDLKLVSPWSTIGFKSADGKVVRLTPDSRGVVSVVTKKGEKLEFIR
jgi:hypothetical protein